MLKHVLIVHYYFPPRGGAAVQRIVKYCKHLQKHGCRVSVLTSGAQYKVLRDESLADTVPPATRVYTTGQNKSVEGQFGRRNILIDAFIPWVPVAIKKAKEIIRKDRIDAVLTTSPPHSQQLIGLYIKTVLHVPWIVDFRDPWTSDQRFMMHKHNIQRLFERLVEKWILKKADRVVATTQRATQSFNRKASLKLDPEKFVWIPNGYDQDDYRHGLAPSATAPLTLTYVGSTGPHISDPAYFLRAVKKLITDHPHLDNRLLVNFVGNAEQRIQKLIQHLKLNHIVHMHGNLPHGEAIRYMQTSHVLLLFELPVLNNSRPTLVIPSKIFEYIGARRPIMAMVNCGDCEDIIGQYGVGEVVDPLDIDAMADLIHAYFMRLEQGRFPVLTDLPQEFCRDAQACRLSKMIHEIS